MGSGNKGGYYYKYAKNLAYKVSQENPNIVMQVKSTAGTNGNIRLLRQNFINAAIAQSDVLNDAMLGLGEYKDKPTKNITVLGALYSEAIQIVASDTSIHNIYDLAGKRVSVGEEESGVIRNAKIILGAFGLSFEDVKKENMGFSESAAALKEGRIDAFFCTAGYPTPAISELSESKGIQIISIDSTDIARIERMHNEFFTMTIPAGTYKNQETPAYTFGVKAVLVANKALSESVAQKLTEAIFTFENAPSLEYATSNVPVRFHPGALRYYESKGLKITSAK